MVRVQARKVVLTTGGRRWLEKLRLEVLRGATLVEAMQATCPADLQDVFDGLDALHAAAKQDGLVLTVGPHGNAATLSGAKALAILVIALGE